MPIEGITEHDFSENQFDLAPLPKQSGKYTVDMTESQLMELIGRKTIELFSLIQQAQIQKVSPVVVFQPQQVKVVEHIQEVVKEILPPVQEEAVVTQVEENTTVEEPVTEKEILSTQEVPVTAPLPEIEMEELPPPVAPMPSQKSREEMRQVISQVKQMIATYQEQIGLLTESLSEEKKLLATQDKIQQLQNVNRQDNTLIAQREDRLTRIAAYEREIEFAKAKIEELLQTLQDISDSV